MQLSEHFTIEEMTRSATAAKLNINNTPGPQELKNLQILCLQVLEPVRKELGRPLTVTSGYRCKALNKAVGGVPGSYHVMGMAADLACNNYASAKHLADALNNQVLTDLVLVEFSRRCIWVHCQWSLHPRHKVDYHYKAQEKHC